MSSALWTDIEQPNLPNTREPTPPASNRRPAEAETQPADPSTQTPHTPRVTRVALKATRPLTHTLRTIATTTHWRTVLHWLVVAAALGYLAWRVPGMVTQFSHATIHWTSLTAAILTGIAALAAYGELHRQLLLVGGVRLRVRTIQEITFAQNAVAVTVPVVGGAGALGYAMSQLRRRGVDSALAAWTVLLAGVISSVILLVLGALGLAWAGRIPVLVAISAAAIVSFGVTGCWLLLTHPAALERGLHLLPRLGHRTPGLCEDCKRTWADRADQVARRLATQVAALRPSGARWTLLIAVGLLSWAFDFLTLVASAKATDAHIPVDVLAVGFVVVQASIALQILPGGAGLAEAGLLSILLGSGVAAAPAAATVLIYRVISWLGLSVVGWVVYAMQPHGKRVHHHGDGQRDESTAFRRSSQLAPAPR
jgi:uncharacterized protein (TIRG00374 family)